MKQRWQKVLKVYKVYQKKKTVPGIRVRGDYITRYGFKLGDTVRLTVDPDKIVIELEQEMKERLDDLENRRSTRLASILSSVANLKPVFHPKKRQVFLKVHSVYQNGKYVPAIKLSGEWLYEYGVRIGDEYNLLVEEGLVVIWRKDDLDNKNLTKF